VLSTGLVVQLVVAFLTITLAARACGAAAVRAGQPAVIGEIIGGIALGPSVLGVVAPDLRDVLLPSAVFPALGMIAEAGVVLYMFLVGLELETEMLRGRTTTTIASALGGLLLSAALGAALAVAIHDRFAPVDVSVPLFTAFVAVAMAVTAFPVLARILSDLKLERTNLGAQALGSAAVADLVAWCALAGIAGYAQSDGRRGPIVAALAVGFVTAILALGRRLGRSADPWIDRLSLVPALVAVLVLLVVSAWTTHTLGVHAVIGAFLAGAIVPARSRVARVLTDRLGRRSVAWLLPAFFALAGARTDIGLLGPSDWTIALVVIVVASVGKVGGGVMAAMATGMTGREALTLGVLMNTRGLIEIVVLNLGLELGLVTPTLFTILVLMAIVTTVATAPIVRRLVRLPNGAAPH
jgi:Kef-type K+ transport system membrane component KefB